MNAMKIHKMLDEAYDVMKKEDNQITRNAVLSLLDLYNAAADNCPEVYQKLKNAGTSEAIWIIADK